MDNLWFLPIVIFYLIIGIILGILVARDVEGRDDFLANVALGIVVIAVALFWFPGFIMMAIAAGVGHIVDKVAHW